MQINIISFFRALIVSYAALISTSQAMPGFNIFPETEKPAPAFFSATEQKKKLLEKLQSEIETAAHLALKLEFDFIDKVFELGDLENLSKDDLKNFIKHRVNTKMGDLGLKPLIPSDQIDAGALKTMKWFDAVIAGKQHTDFFASRVTNYSKGHMDWSKAF